MSAKGKFAIPSLVAAGLIGPSVAAADPPSPSGPTGPDDVTQLPIGELHEFQLAQHQSHQSHGSHGSHYSHRSYYKPLPDEGEEDGFMGPDAFLGRNEQSTPRSFVLPSSPALATNSERGSVDAEKARKLVVRVQLALFTRGYDVGAVDGTLNPKTVAAIYRFQKSIGLIPSGTLAPEVLDALGVVAQ